MIVPQPSGFGRLATDASMKICPAPFPVDPPGAAVTWWVLLVPMWGAAHFPTE